MVPIPGVVQYLRSKLVVDVVLIGVLAVFVFLKRDSILDHESIMTPEAVVESEDPVIPVLVQNNCLRPVHLDAASGIHVSFPFIEGPNPDCYFHTHAIFLL